MTDTVELPPTGEDMGRRIRIQVERHNLTVKKAAYDCNLSQATFETYLYGKSMPGSVALASLARGLRCTSDWLLTGKETA